MIESMACGTPVLAFRGGSVDEVITPGVTGAVVTSVDEAVQTLPAVAALDRAACRQEFERRFSVARMVEKYLRVYRRLMGVDREIEDAGWEAGLASHG
jgi:glycosyltransferase involved in cell wall biosynthesis